MMLRDDLAQLYNVQQHANEQPAVLRMLTCRCSHLMRGCRRSGNRWMMPIFLKLTSPIKGDSSDSSTVASPTCAQISQQPNLNMRIMSMQLL